MHSSDFLRMGLSVEISLKKFTTEIRQDRPLIYFLGPNRDNNYIHITFNI